MTKTRYVCGDPVGPHNRTGMCRRCYHKKYREDNSEKKKAHQRKWYEENTDKAKAYSKEWREDNSDRANVYQRKYRDEHRDKKIAVAKEWNETNPDKYKAYQRKWYEENTDKAKELNKKWRDENPERVREMRHERRIYLSAYGDCKKLNNVFPGCHAHHIDPDTIMHIPESLHLSIWHTIKIGQGMEEINIHAFNWLNRVHAESLQTTLDAFG